MPETLFVKVAECVVSGAPGVLSTQGIGSCVAVCLYEKIAKVGALAHVMLPKSYNLSDAGIPDNIYRAMDTAIPAMMQEFSNRNIKPAQLCAKLAGGAHMFRVLGGNENDIGTRNVRKAEEMLDALGVSIEAEEVGGNVGRSLTFDLDTGIVYVTTKM